MNIFITGSTGFIGKNLIEFYQNHHIFKYHREPLQETLSWFQPDVIINCAAEIYDSAKMFDSNVLLTKECAEYVRKYPHTKMIQIGSSSEYGPLAHAGSEQDRINPVDMYQATKGMATIMCQGYARQYGLNISIARPYSVYGRYEKPHRLFPMLWKAFVLDRPMDLYDGYHDFIYINDFIKGIDTLVQNNNIPPGDIVNFGSGKQYSNFEILNLFEKITKKPAPVTKIGLMAKKFESSLWCCDTTYASTQYQFNCEFSIEQGIIDFLHSADYRQV